MTQLAGTTESFLSLGDTLMKIASAPSDMALWQHVKKFTGKLGFSYLTAVDAPKLAGGLAHAAFYSDMSDNTLAAMDSEHLVEAHPIIQHCLESDRPFKLSKLRNHPDQKGKRWIELLADVVVQGDALIVPIYRTDHLSAAFLFGGANPDFRQVSQLMLQLIAFAAFARANLLSSDTHQSYASPLTVRETHCLRWIAEGKTDDEVGQVLGISGRTVRFHADNAKKKLGATTRVQAVARAINDSLIAISSNPLH
jgi:DNA-binding CsgD family transcriptional regulator